MYAGLLQHARTARGLELQRSSVGVGSTLISGEMHCISGTRGACSHLCYFSTKRVQQSGMTWNETVCYIVPYISMRTYIDDIVVYV